MRLSFLFLITVIFAYSLGLVADALANTENSKVYSLTKTGKFGSNWLPFNLDEEILEVNSFKQTFPFGGGPYYFMETAYLSEEAANVFDHAKIDFKISTDQKPDGTFSNRVTECIFETDVDVNTECVVCLLRDWSGTNIAKGEQFFEPPYLANTRLPLVMTEFLNDDEYIIDVRNVKSVEIGICKEQNGGCTPGFWKQPQHFDSWVNFSPIPLESHYDGTFVITSSFGGTFTLHDALSQGGGGENALGRHAVAALLNTQNDDVSYSFTQTQVIEIVQDAYDTNDFETAKNILAGENEQICPLN